MSRPPLLERLAYDPILYSTDLIAEAWDAGGLYQVGSFHSWNRWAEWNGKYRDDLRSFLKGDEGLAGAAAMRILGSPDLYPREKRGDNASVNFITCHDGFTLYDLYSYNQKHNEDNGWDTPTEPMTTGAGTAEKRARQKILKFSGYAGSSLKMPVQC